MKSTDWAKWKDYRKKRIKKRSKEDVKIDVNKKLGKVNFIKRNWRKGIKEKESQTEKSRKEDRSRRATRDN